MSLVLINNHTAVWGSFYSPSTGEWGYACCQSTIHASYCAGEAGIEAAQASDVQNLLIAAPPFERDRVREQQSRPMVDQHLEDMARGKGKESDRDRDRDEPSSLAKKHLGEGDVRLDKDKLAEAIKAEREKKRKGSKFDESDNVPSGKRKKYNDGFSSGNHEVTEEELGTSMSGILAPRPLLTLLTEAYRMNRRAGFDDPMFGYVDKEE